MFWLGPKTLSSRSSFALMFPPRGFSYRCRRLLIRCEGPAPLRRRARRRAPRVSRTSFRAIAGGRCHLYLNHLFTLTVGMTKRYWSRNDYFPAATLSLSAPIVGRSR